MGNIFTLKQQQGLNNVEFNSSTLSINNLLLNDNDEEGYKIISENLYGAGSTGGGQFNQSRIYLIKKQNKYYTMKQVNKTTSDNTDNDSNSCDADDKLSYAIAKGNQLLLLKKHENLISYIESYQEINKICIIMDYCYGNTLKERIELQLNKKLHNTHHEQIHFNETIIWYWLLNILNGLKYLHLNEIYHLNMQPNNIYINLENGMCKIGDFCLDKIDINYFKMLNIKEYTSLLYKPPEYRFINDYKFNLNNQILMKCLYEKCDIFSFGCVLYELTYLKRAIMNPFLKNFNPIYDECENYSKNLVKFIKLCLEHDYEKRLTSNELFNLDIVQNNYHKLMDYQHENNKKNVYFNVYKENVIPSINFKLNYGHLCKTNGIRKVHLDYNFKPSSLNTFKYYNNLIMLTLNKYLIELDYSFLFNTTITTTASPTQTITKSNSNKSISTSLSVVNDQIQSKLIVYNEFGECLHEFCSYLIKKSSNLESLIDNQSTYIDENDDFDFDNVKNNDDLLLFENYERKYFNFKIYSTCIDELNSYIYISTDVCGILRFKYLSHFYKSELFYDTKLNFNEINQKLNLNKHKNVLVKCMHLIEINEINYDRNLLLSDDLTMSLISIKFKTFKKQFDYHIEWIVPIKDKTSARSVCLQHQTIFQILATNSEILCLLNDFVTIQVYYLKTGLFKRDNKHKLNLFNLHTIQALCVDSDYNVYSTDGYKFYSINVNTFDLYNILEVFDEQPQQQQQQTVNTTSNTVNKQQRQPLFESILFMKFLVNGKIVLLKDAVQTENAVLYVLKPNFNYQAFDEIE